MIMVLSFYTVANRQVCQLCKFCMELLLC